MYAIKVIRTCIHTCVIISWPKYYDEFVHTSVIKISIWLLYAVQTYGKIIVG